MVDPSQGRGLIRLVAMRLTIDDIKVYTKEGLPIPDNHREAAQMIATLRHHCRFLLAKYEETSRLLASEQKALYDSYTEVSRLNAFINNLRGANFRNAEKERKAE